MIFCGTGNNGGDGLVIARKLAEQGIVVSVCFIGELEKSSIDFKTNLNRLPPNIIFSKLVFEKDIPQLDSKTLVVDAILGSGLNKELEGIFAHTIDAINNSDSFVIAIDIPSGLPAEIADVESIQNCSIMQADITYTFQVLKQSFLHAETFSFVGDIEVIDIGLLPDFLNSIDSSLKLIDHDFVKSIYKPRTKFSHKGVFGHALVVAGSYGKLGAAILSSKAALRAGCGLVTSFVPKVGFTILQTALPEVMVQTDDELFEIRNFPETESYSAVGVGPGLGTNLYTEKGLLKWLLQIHQPMVMDADALNICATYIQEHSSFCFPQNCIITPHPKEFDRLAGKSHSSFERTQKQLAFAKKYNVVVVLKGAYTSIALPNGVLYINTSGNVALATAGIGDVLTGILTSLLAQSYSPEQAAILGVYLHGVCADMWVDQGNKTMIAGDIIEMIPKAYYKIFD